MLAPICEVPYLILVLVAGYLEEEDLLKQGWCLPAQSLLVIELEPSRFSTAFSEPQLGLEGVTAEPSVPASTSGDAPKRPRPPLRTRLEQLALFDPASGAEKTPTTHTRVGVESDVGLNPSRFSERLQLSPASGPRRPTVHSVGRSG